MSSNFPAAIDTTSELPDAATMHAQTLGSFPHSALHGNVDEAVIALETKVGVTGSADHASLDWIVANLQAQITALQATVAVPVMPVGAFMPYGGTTAPSGFVMGDGAAISRSTYAALFAVYGIQFGAGNGTTTFNVPNLTNRVPVGAGGLYARGATGGEATHTLTVPEIPSHDHDSDAAFAFTSGIRDYEMLAAGNLLGAPNPAMQLSPNTTIPVGGGGAHNNMQPYVAVNFIIKT